MTRLAGGVKNHCRANKLALNAGDEWKVRLSATTTSATHTHTHAIYFCNCNHWQYTDIFCHFAILQAAFKLSIFLRMNIHLLFCYFDRSTLYVQLVRLSVDNVCTITCNYIILLLIADIRDSSFFHICAYPTYIVAYSYVYICQ